MLNKKVTVLDFAAAKKSGEKLTMVTCYDYPSALVVEKSNIDAVLVGDTVSMVVHGHNDTTKATMEMMELHIAAVARGLKSKMIVGDLPFLSYRQGINTAMRNIDRLIKAGAHTVKLEGAEGNIDLIKHVVASGVPVMGHIGLTPQFVNAFGGFKTQGKNPEGRKKIIEEAKQLESAGCFAVVLECIPMDLAEEITSSISIPTIGIGSGNVTNGQILVMHDMLGFYDWAPKFVKKYNNFADQKLTSINSYVEEVKSLKYPKEGEHTY